MSYDITHLDVTDFGENRELAKQVAEKTVEYLGRINPVDKGTIYVEYSQNADSFDIRTRVWQDNLDILRWSDQAFSFVEGYKAALGVK